MKKNNHTVTPFSESIFKYLQFAHLTLKWHVGRRPIYIPLLMSCWALIHIGLVLSGFRSGGYDAVDIQNTLLGFPLYCAAIVLGAKAFSGEIEQRTLETQFTIPNGLQRLLLLKIVSLSLLLSVALTLLCFLIELFLTPLQFMPVIAAFRGMLFYLTLSYFLGVLTRSELVTIIICSGLFIFNLNWTGSIWSPLFNALTLSGQHPDSLARLFIDNLLLSGLAIGLLLFVSMTLGDNRERLLKS